MSDNPNENARSTPKTHLEDSVRPGRTAVVPEPERDSNEGANPLPTDSGVAGPVLPHERDESVSTSPAEIPAVGKQAHADVDRGLVDTDRGPGMGRTYDGLDDADGADEAGETASASSDEQDMSMVRIDDSRSRRFWTRELRVTEEALESAVAAVGSQVERVKDYLAAGQAGSQHTG